MTESKRPSPFPAGVNPFRDNITGTTLLGRYRVVRRLAEGGMGVVYLARAEGAAGFTKPVVLKLILPILANDEQFAGMFIREAKILASLAHPGIVSVIDFAREGDGYVMVQEFVNGYQLGQWCKYRKRKGQTIPTAVAIKIIIDVLDALHYAHGLRLDDGRSLNIIHRDISPANIMLDTAGRVRVVDFGIALMEEKTNVHKVDDEAGFKGKIAYAAPELFDSAPASIQSDVYACGVVLHECLLGYNDFKAEVCEVMLGRVLTHQPVHVSQYRQDVDPQIDRVLQKALEKAPEKRYQTAQELAADLRKVSPLEEQEAATVLQQLIFEDFNDEMASLLGVESLQRREKAWRHPSKAPANRLSVTRELGSAVCKQTTGVQGDFPQEREGDAISQVAQVQKTGVPKAVWLGALVLAVAIVPVGVTIALSRRAPQLEPKILIVQSPVVDPSPANDVESGKAEKESEKQKPLETSGAKAFKEAAPEPVGNAVVAGRENRDNTPGRRASSEVRKLTRAFKKQEGKIRQCFESHALELKGAPEITFRFEIAPDGRVQSASLSPASLASTTLGKCLTRVAVNTPFPALSKSASFTIPVKARRGGEH